MWTEEQSMVASRFLVNEDFTKLVVYMDKQIGLRMEVMYVPALKKAKCMQYFLKPYEEGQLTVANIGESVQYGLVSGSAMDSLLKLMNGVYLPTFLSNDTWPESVKKEFSGQLHKFMASLTETANQVKGHTVLYLPDEDLKDCEAASLDKDLVQRLESTLNYWTKQIKEVVSNQETSHHVDNSGPLEEIEFWRSRTLDLSGIRNQLDRPGVRNIVKVLQILDSSYLTPFQNLSDMIERGSIEANNNLKFLSTLQEPCERLANAEPNQIPAILPEVLNLIRMIWTVSKYYNTDQQLTNLLRKVSNQIIIQCSKKIDLDEIFHGDVVASMVTLRESKACGDAWHECYERVVKAIRNDPSVGEWDFDPSTNGIFAQIDAFGQRCNNLMEVCEGQLQFARKCSGLARGQKAELPAFGGSRGAEIEKSLYEIEEAFDKHIERLAKLDYDILNVKATSWHNHYDIFKSGMKDLEVMMTNVFFVLAWEGATTVESGVEILESFNSLAIRAGMKQSIEKKTIEVYKMFANQIKLVKDEFSNHRLNPYLPQGHPRFAGQALWAKSLLARIEKDYKILTEATFLPTVTKAKETLEQYYTQAGILEGYIRSLHMDWDSDMKEHAAEGVQLQDRLNTPLIFNDTTAAEAKQGGVLANKASGRRLVSNFDKHLLSVFAEVRYWEKFHGDYGSIPYVANEMYSKEGELRILRESVMLVVRDYNTIIESLSVEERKLFAEHLHMVNRKITPGFAQLNWGEKHIKDWFVRVCRQKCQEVYALVLKFKENNNRITENCNKIANCLLVDIEKNVVYDDHIFEKGQIEHQEKVKNQLKACHDDIVDTIRSSYQFFLEHPRDIQKAWIQYIKKVDAQVEVSLQKTVKRSLQELSRAINGDVKIDFHALFKVKMILDESKGKVEFSPSMSDLSVMVKRISRQLITTIQVIPRLSNTLSSAQQFKANADDGVKFAVTGGEEEKEPMQMARNKKEKTRQTKQQSFYSVISNNVDILKILVVIMAGTTNVAVELGNIITNYDKYQPIWSTDKQAFIRRYAITKRPLSSFDMDITRYKNNQQDIQSEESFHTVEFIRVDCSHLKASLVKHCQQWQLKLTNLLHHNANTELLSLHDLFSSNTTKLKVKPDSLDLLSDCINLQKKLQSEQPTIEARFDPIEETYKTLDKFDVHVEEKEKDLLDHLRVEWGNFKSVLSDAEVMLNLKKDELKRELEDNLVSYTQHVTDTRSDFRENGPFMAPGPGQGDPDIEGAFEFIGEFRKRIADNRAKAEAMKKGMSIFSIHQPEYKETEDTERELDMLDKVWSLMRDWLNKWEGWKTNKFSDLDVNELDTDAINFQNHLKKLPRGVRHWKVWKSLLEIISRFRQTMPLILDLRSPAMRPRHWEQLQEEISQPFDPDADDFTLNKLTALGIHLHADVIRNLAAKAQRQLNIENHLKEIARVWGVQTLEIKPYKNRYFKLKQVDDVNDILENHQMLLATMKNSPYFLTFAKDINHWVRTLNDVVETLEMLVQVQRQWMYLESIFMDSPNIRKELPSESTLFETVNNHWIEIMDKLNTTGLAIDTLKDGLLDRLTRMNETLDKINHSLDEYLEKKRQLFPRFYFLSNDDLLEILGHSRDPIKVQKHIRKFFAGIQTLDLLASQKNNSKSYEVVGINSPDGEEIKLFNPVVVEGEVENWLSEVETNVAETLQKLLFHAIPQVHKAPQKKSTMENWIKQTKGQLLITSGQIGWTTKCQMALGDPHKNKRAIKKLLKEWREYLVKLADFVRNDITSQDRLKVVALITIEVHARDVIERLKIASKGKVNQNSFEWMSQLRFTFDRTQGEYGKCLVRQTNTLFEYGYEYQGNSGRLVITPLTDRCYMTLTTALHLCRGGSPQGPAGTGKTETVKDLGKALGYFVVVFNCSPKMNVGSLSKCFSGLAQTGAWGCFDEFNRILVEVLSVVALQISSILSAVKENAARFVFQGDDIRLIKSVGVFVTMNPGYAGRSELPDNLKSLFRPVAMMVPDSQLIAEIMLQSQGFKDAENLSTKITTMYQLMNQQLSKQAHYAYGLRAIKSVLVRAGTLNRRRDIDMTEELILMKAIRDMNASKMTGNDIVLFDALLEDTFSDTDIPNTSDQYLVNAIEEEIQRQGLQQHDELSEKILQLYHTLRTRHGNMLVGETLSGKSTAIKVLSRALTSLAKRSETKKLYNRVEVSIFNPKAIDTDELYGNFNVNTKEWKDGIFSENLRIACQDTSSTEKWFLLDGPVDTLWVESINTVLDDNKVLTLINGDRISLTPQVSLLFEVLNLNEASPATVSRCGMVYMDAGLIGWRPYVQSWLKKKKILVATNPADENEEGKDSKEGGDLLSEGKDEQPSIWTKEAVEYIGKLFEKFLVPILKFMDEDEEVGELIPICKFNAVQSLCRLFDSFATKANGVDPAEEGHYLRIIEMWFIFAIVWSVGGALNEESRPKLNEFIREIETQFHPLQTCYEYFPDPKKRDWGKWDDLVNSAWRPPANVPYFQLLVPTIDTIRYQSLLNGLIKNKHNVLIVGQTGTGKTAIIQNHLNGQDNTNTLVLNLNFCASTSSRGVQSMIESRLEKRQRSNYGPQGARSKLIVFIDDLNMPAKEVFGAQPPIELLRLLADNGFWYDREKRFKKTIVQTQMVAAMGPPGGARSEISTRFMSCFNVINFTVPEDSQIKRIFRALLVNHLSDFDEVIKPLGPQITNATLDLYKVVRTDFRPTPSCCHYLFNMRDMSRVFQGMLQSDPKYYDTRENFIKLWAHESLRIFHDRLVSQADREHFIDLMNQKMQSSLETTYNQLFKEGEVPLFGNFLEDFPTVGGMIGDDDDDKAPPYQELTHRRDFVKQMMEETLLRYNQEPDNVAADLVLFESAIDHICRVYRIIMQPRGSAMLIGVGGSGRQSLTRLASFIADYHCKQIKPTKNYRIQDFREDLKELYKLTGVEKEETVFLISDTQIIYESFLEDINNILNSGEVPNLFPQDELTPILEELRADAKAAERPTSQDALYAYLIERVRDNLHVVLAISPVGKSFRDRVRMYPAFVNCMTLDWYSDWPEAALVEVADRFLEDIDLGGAKVQAKLAKVFCSIHTSATNMSHKMLTELKRSNYITPTKYLDLVLGYRSLLNEKRDKISSDADKLKNGLSKLDESREQVKDMTRELEEKKRTVAQKKSQCDKLLVEIVQKQRLAEEQKKQVQLDENRLAIESKECQTIKIEAQEALGQVTPSLDKAVVALQKLSKSAVTEVKSYKLPPKAVVSVMCAVMVLLQREPSWSSAKKELSNPNFLKNLQGFDRDNISNSTLKQISKYTKQKDFNPDDITNVSDAAGRLCEWVVAMELYAKVYRDVEPRRIALKKAELALKEKEDQLQNTKDVYNQVSQKVQMLEDKYKKSEEDKASLQKEAKDLEAKLTRAGKLVAGLSGERKRWEDSIVEFQKDIKHLVGDCTVAAAFLAYAGPFPSEYREVLVNKHWLAAVNKANLPVTADFAFSNFLADPTDVMEWNMQGLPTDDFSTENGVLVLRGNRWPLMIDPQAQANLWIKAKDRNIVCMNFQTENYLRKLENCIQSGKPVLFEDIGETLEPALEPILNISSIDRQDMTILQMGDKELAYNPDFRLYFTTKMQNPHYKPEVSTKTTVVNFAVKEKGLQDQLLGIVVRFEEAKLEADKAELVRTVAANKRKLIELEDQILSLLETADTNLIEDENLINALQMSKKTAEDVKIKLENSVKTEAKIDAAREGYRPCAVRASLCFFVLNDLASVDPMYQFSLKSYVDLFKVNIESSKDEKMELIDLSERIEQLNDYHTEAVYRYTCRALFEKHKLLFAFQLCVQKIRSEGDMDEDEYSFFLRGGQILDRSMRPPNPCADWLSEQSWDSICMLDKLPVFKNIAHSFEQSSGAWRQWYRSDDPPPEKLPPPGEFQTKRNEFQQMLILRCLRPDRVVFAARSFIANNLGPQYIESPPFVLRDVYAASNERTPLIFVLSPGVDPSITLKTFAMQMDRRLEVLPLGQGQTPTAIEAIEYGVQHGTWVFLANCHLSMSWMPELDKIVEQLSIRKPKPHPNFRLWLSSDPHPDFPISLLQGSVKMTTEPPRGLRANMLRLVDQTDKKEYLRCKKQDKYRKLYFSLCWFHSLVVERKKFGSLGFNRVYAFNDSDFQVCEDILALYLDLYEETPWDALKYLIAQANYGGRVTDNLDRRVLRVYIDQFFNDAILNIPKANLSSLENMYQIPLDGSLDSYRKYINEWPKAGDDPPEAFGQHPNADIASQMEETKTLLGTILALQPVVVTEGAKSREEVVEALIVQLKEQCPEPLNLKKIKDKHRLDAKNPLRTVLLQEIDRYNVLLTTIHRSLEELRKGIRGEVVISQTLERMFESLFNARVPGNWGFAYQSLKPLGPWVRELGQRIAQLQKWANEGPPKVFWLTGFTFPVGFLTALLQKCTRNSDHSDASIDELSWDFSVLNHTEQSISMEPKEGAYIKGLFLEGARWDSDNGCLAEPYPMELYCPVPIMHFKPVFHRKSSGKGHYKTPLYIYPIRTGTRERPSFVLEVDLKAGAKDANFWTKRGTALLLSLDH